MQFLVPEVPDLMYVGCTGMCSVSSKPGKSDLPCCRLCLSSRSEAGSTCLLLNINAQRSWRTQRANRAALGELFSKESLLKRFNHSLRSV